MTHRLYPNPTRALKYVDRRKFELGPKPLLAAALPPGREAGARLARAMSALPSAEDYRLSTRRDSRAS